MEVSNEEHGLPIQQQLTQIITQLDALIRGRKIDLVPLRLKASVLLSSSFDVGEGSDQLSNGSIVKQGIKIHNMLRSPRFSTKDGQNVFLILRVAATNIITSRKDESDSTNAVLESLRLNAKSASELAQIQEMKEISLKVISFIEKKWASLDGNFISRLLPNELKECEKLVAEALVNKADILAEHDQANLAIKTLESKELTDLLKGSENAGMVLSTKAFRYGQHLLMKRDNSKSDTQSNAGLAILCFESSLRFLEKPRTGIGGGVSRFHADQTTLKSKCLVQLALALHLDKRHDEALEKLNLVDSEVLIQDTEDLRFGILLATNCVDELHLYIKKLIQSIPGEGFKTPMRLGDAPEVTRILLWVRRIAMATQFDEATLQHYQDLQSKWQDDHRYLEVRTQLLSGIFANQNRGPSAPAPVVTDSSTSDKSSLPLNIHQGLALCDNILFEHQARQRILSAKHLTTIEVALMHALNASFRSGDHNSVIELATRFTQCIVFACDSEGNTSNNMKIEKDIFLNHREQGEKYAYALLMQADALFELGKLSDAFDASSAAFEIHPSTEAFVIRFQSIFFGGGSLEDCQLIIENLSQKQRNVFPTPESALDAIYQIVTIIGSSSDAEHQGGESDDAMEVVIHPQKQTSINHLEDLEITALIAYARSFEYFVSAGTIKPAHQDDKQLPLSNTFSSSSSVKLSPSFAAFLLNIYLIGKGDDQPIEEEEEAEAATSRAEREEKRLLSSTQCLIAGTHFLLQEESLGHVVYSSSPQNLRLFASFEEVQSLSIACWDITRSLGDRGMFQCGGVDEGGFTVITNLLLAAHELQIVAERIEKSSVIALDLTQSKTRFNENSLNRIGLLTMAASEVINQALLPIPTSLSDNECSSTSSDKAISEAKKAQVMKALEWIEMAQEICQQMKNNTIANSENERKMLSQEQQLTSLRVTLSTLKLMAGLHGMYLSPSFQKDGTEAKLNTSKTSDMLLDLVEDCKEDLTIVPPDTLRAAASAMKQHGKPAVAFRLLKIAIDRLQTKKKSSHPSGTSEMNFESTGQLIMYSCDLFHVAPTTDVCLEIIEDILGFLESPANATILTEHHFVDPDAIEIITCNCYNWGIQGLSLGLMNSGSECERLIGKAQELLPYCSNLAHHEEDFTQAYQRALEAKEQQHEAIAIHTQQMDSNF